MIKKKRLAFFGKNPRIFPVGDIRSGRSITERTPAIAQQCAHTLNDLQQLYYPACVDSDQILRHTKGIIISSGGAAVAVGSTATFLDNDSEA